MNYSRAFEARKGWSGRYILLEGGPEERVPTVNRTTIKGSRQESIVTKPI